MKPTEKLELEETLLNLTKALKDVEVMNGVMTSIFTSIDADGDGTLDPKELLMFLTGLAPADDPPDEGQVWTLFKQLDLNGDRQITREELEIVVRHLFTQQVRVCKDKLHLNKDRKQ